MTNHLLSFLFNGPRDNKSRRGDHRDAVRGDILCVEDGLLKRYGVCTSTSEKIIFYGENSHGVRVVHEVSFSDFLKGAEHFSICDFPKEYGRPTEWEQTSPITGVVMPQHKIYGILNKLWKIRNYRRYSHEETARRAEGCLGSKGYATSEHFAIWCKTGISESHELESLQELLDRIVVY